MLTASLTPQLFPKKPPRVAPRQTPAGTASAGHGLLGTRDQARRSPQRHSHGDREPGTECRGLPFAERGLTWAELGGRGAIRHRRTLPGITNTLSESGIGISSDSSEVLTYKSRQTDSITAAEEGPTRKLRSSPRDRAAADGHHRSLLQGLCVFKAFFFFLKDIITQWNVNWAVNYM